MKGPESSHVFCNSGEQAFSVLEISISDSRLENQSPCVAYECICRGIFSHPTPPRSASWPSPMTPIRTHDCGTLKRETESIPSVVAATEESSTTKPSVPAISPLALPPVPCQPPQGHTTHPVSFCLTVSPCPFVSLPYTQSQHLPSPSP